MRNGIKRQILTALVLGVAATSLLTIGKAEAAAALVEAERSEVNTGETVDVPIVLQRVKTGVSDGSITVRLTDPGLAEFVGYDFSGFAIANGTLVSGAELLIDFDDLGDNFTSASRTHVLGTVTILGIAGGKTDIAIEVHSLDDDDGVPISPRTKEHVLTVIQTSSSTQQMDVAVGEIASIPMTVMSIDKGIADFDVTVSLSDSMVVGLLGIDISAFPDAQFEMLSNSDIRVTATDSTNAVEGRHDSFTLFSLNVIGQEAGVSNLTMTINSMTDDTGGAMDTGVQDWTLSVQ